MADTSVHPDPFWASALWAKEQGFLWLKPLVVGGFCLMFLLLSDPLWVRWGLASLTGSLALLRLGCGLVAEFLSSV
jgi:hypothetical protein